MSYKQKLVGLDELYEDSNKDFDNKDFNFSFISSYKELASAHSCNVKYLSKSIRSLEELGFIKLEHFYVREKLCKEDNNLCYNYHKAQERKDKSLWKINLILPNNCITELELQNNRTSLEVSQSKITNLDSFNELNTVNPKPSLNYLTLEGIRFDLSLEQISMLRSNIKDNNIALDIVSVDNTNNVNEGAASIDINLNTVDTNTVNISSLPLQSSNNELISNKLSNNELHSNLNTYIDSVIDELEQNEDLDKDLEEKLTQKLDLNLEDTLDLQYINTNTNTTSNTSASTNIHISNTPLVKLAKTEENTNHKTDTDNNYKTVGIKSDPSFAKSVPLLNKYIKLKINIKSNLRASSDVTFNKFLEKIRKDEKRRSKKFSIASELIRTKLKELPKDKADKARKYAYSIASKKLAKGYAADLDKHELAKQLIHHAATWKPTKLGTLSKEARIDAALSFAYRAITNGTWKIPLEWEKANILDYEYQHYGRKHKETGILSDEIFSLEATAKKLLKTNYLGLRYIIEKEWGFEGERSKRENEQWEHRQEEGQDRAHEEWKGGVEQEQRQGKGQITEQSYGGKVEDKWNKGQIAGQRHKDIRDSIGNSSIQISYGGYNKNSSIALKKNIELPSFPKEREAYLSYCGNEINSSDIKNQNYLNSKIVQNNSKGLAIEMDHNCNDITTKDITISKDEDINRIFGNTISTDVIDFSNITNKQKYIKITTSEQNNEIIIKTINNKEFLFKLKEMTSNDIGDTIMTLSKVELGAFVKELNEGVIEQNFIRTNSYIADNKLLE